jgi:hypothetical protein
MGRACGSGPIQAGRGGGSAGPATDQHDLWQGPERKGKAVARLRLARWALSLLVAVALVAGVAVLLLAPSQPAVLPADAVPLALRTQSARFWPFSFGCGLAGLTPIRVERDGVAMVFADEATGSRMPVVWPNGFSARLKNGRAELVPPRGSVLARDGDVISGLASGAADNGDLLVCLDGASQPVVEQAP